MSSIDAVYEILRDVRLTGSIFSRADLSAPWGFSTRGADAAIFHAVVRGSAWLIADGHEPIPLNTGELVVVPSGMPHIMCDDPCTAPEPIGGLTTYEEGGRIGLLRGGGDGPTTELLCGTFTLDATAEQLLPALLPSVVHIQHGATTAWLASTVDMIVAELRAGRPGHGLVVDRLADVLLIRVLRGHIASMTPVDGGWLGGLRDDRIARALAWLHRDPSEEWTAEALANRAGMSRSAFYARFIELVGEPPAAYVARCRMDLARRALSSGANLADVAAQVGYSSEAALSKAFKRHTGVSPGAWRRAAQ